MLDATPRLSALGSSSSGYSVGRPVGWRRILGLSEASGSDENVDVLVALGGAFSAHVLGAGCESLYLRGGEFTSRVGSERHRLYDARVAR